MRCPKKEDAPAQTDCLTAIEYIYRNTIDFLIDWIGNMPQHLLQQPVWKVQILNKKELQTGDLLFLKHKKSKRTITHLAMAIDSDHVFHCSEKHGGGAIEKIDSVFSTYTQPSLIAMLTYQDPRGSWLSISEQKAM